MIIKQELIAKIVAIEWAMFQSVPNIGGRAPCQDNKRTFEVMRSSQLVACSENVLSSYLQDLLEADSHRRNLLTEKYARMMEFTAPLEYARIQECLPALDEEALLLIGLIVKIHMAWNAEIQTKFTDIRKLGRPVFATADTSNITSLETYLRGELSTYSVRTLRLYYQDVLQQREQNINGAEIILDEMMHQYGFTSLAEANKLLGDKV